MAESAVRLCVFPPFQKISLYMIHIVDKNEKTAHNNKPIGLRVVDAAFQGDIASRKAEGGLTMLQGYGRLLCVDGIQSTLITDFRL
jgi:hypothetical protein